MFNEINLNTELTHYPFPSIGNFANIIPNICHIANYAGQVNGKAIYNKYLPLPTISYVGTVKLHGTNGAIVIDFVNEIIYFQARNDVRTPVVDNAGFATYMSSIQIDIVNMVKSNIETIGLKNNVVVLFGEWCGSNIQGGVALSEIEKMFVIAKVAIVDKNTRQKTWLNIEETKKFKLIEKKIFNIYDFKTFNIDIDFNNYHEIINTIYEWTMDVENMCPVAKQFGIEGIGEGIVFSTEMEKYKDSGFWFKSKGSKHSKSKVKVARPVDDEKIAKLINIADKITPSWRLEQMFNETFDIINGGLPDRAKIGQYLKSVNNDIIKEELQLLIDEVVEFKTVVKYVSKIATDYFFMMEKEILETKS